MKVNLMWGGTPKNGYTNIDPYGNPEDPLVINNLVTDIDDIVDDCEATEIVAEDVIDFLERNEMKLAIQHWARKLRHKSL
jgi:hypothetical protein